MTDEDGMKHDLGLANEAAQAGVNNFPEEKRPGG